MKKGLLVYNPKSGNSLSKKLEKVTSKFRSRGIEIDTYPFDPDEEKLLAVLDNGYDLIVLAGGDGTLNFAVNVLLDNNIDIPVGLMPSGTCNDFARSLGIPKDINMCIELIAGGKTKKIDVGLVNKKRYFLSTFGGGLFMGASFDSSITELKKRFGPIAYYLKGLTEMINVRSFPLKIRTEEKTLEEDALLFLVMNGKHAAGFPPILNHADMSDGLMEIIIVKKCMQIDLTKLFLKVFSNEVENDDNIISMHAKKCHINIPSDMSITIDGERGESADSEINVLKEKIRIFAE